MNEVCQEIRMLSLTIVNLRWDYLFVGGVMRALLDFAEGALALGLACKIGTNRAVSFKYASNSIHSFILRPNLVSAFIYQSVSQANKSSPSSKQIVCLAFFVQ